MLGSNFGVQLREGTGVSGQQNSTGLDITLLEAQTKPQAFNFDISELMHILIDWSPCCDVSYPGESELGSDCSAQLWVDTVVAGQQDGIGLGTTLLEARTKRVIS